jgi:hypothetical protein
MENRAVSLLEGLNGKHIVGTFLLAVAGGFLAVIVDVYVLNKLETMVGIAPTVY